MGRFERKELAKWMKWIRDCRLRRRSLKDYKEEIVYAGLPPFEPKEGDYILDVGCGHAVALQEMYPIVGTSGRLVGIDVDEHALGLALKEKITPCFYFSHGQRRIFSRIRAHEKRAGKRYVILYQTDASYMVKCPDGFFDKVVSIFAIQWAPNKLDTLMEILRVLKPGGEAWLVGLGKVYVLEEEVENKKEIRRRICDFPHPPSSFQVLEILQSTGIKATEYDFGDFIEEYFGNIRLKKGRLSEGVYFEKGKSTKPKKKIPRYSFFVMRPENRVYTFLRR